jgi:hypothetical protein
MLSVNQLNKVKGLIFFSLLIIVTGCYLDNSNSKYLRWVGDSEQIPEIDTFNFKICTNEYAVKQYFHFDKGLQYEGGKSYLTNYFMKQYVPVEENQSGWIRIRFIVNCKGETGRFRIIESDENYQERKFDSRITNQLLKITQSLDGWKIQSIKDNPKDYYQYLIFKIHNGNIIEIMP